MPDSNAGRSHRKAARPKKPYPDFPLTPHASGKWMKKIRGRIHYFGSWAKRENGKLVRVEGNGWKEALEAYKAQADDLHAGRTPRVQSDGLTFGELRERFLTAKSRALDAGEITSRTYSEYRGTADRLLKAFGENRLVEDLASDDFETYRAKIAEKWGPVRLGNEIQRVRTIFKYGYESGLIEKPVRYGPQFKKPSAGVLRRHRAKMGDRMLDAAECRKLLDAAPVQLKAMLMLGLNCALGGHDCALLPTSALDLDAGWINYPRAKTGIARRCPLWEETVKALRGAIAERSEPKQDEARELVFVTVRGRPWLTRGETQSDPITQSVIKLMKEVKVHRRGLGPYTLRHVFRTVADETRDQVATDIIMGHTDASMGARYRERVDDSRLVAVTEHVRQWLFGGSDMTPKSKDTQSGKTKPRTTKSTLQPTERPTLKLFAR